MYFLNAHLRLNAYIKFEARWLTFTGHNIILLKEIKWKLKWEITTM